MLNLFVMKLKNFKSKWIYYVSDMDMHRNVHGQGEPLLMKIGLRHIV